MFTQTFRVLAHVSFLTVGGMFCTNVYAQNLVYTAGNFTLAQGMSVAFGPYTLVMQGDGNLVLYGSSDVAVWNTGTYGQDCGMNQCFATFQSDGNFVVYNGSTALWSTVTYGNPAAQLVLSQQSPQLEITANQSILWANVVIFSAGNLTLPQGASVFFDSSQFIMQSDGNLVLYGPGGTVLWNSGTYGQDCSSDQCYTIFQSDGNGVIYNGSTPIDNTATYGNPGAEFLLFSQAPYVEVVSSNQSVLWAGVPKFSTGTFKLAQGASFAIGSLSLVMQGDGNLVLYDADGTAVWNTGTYGQDCSSDQCYAIFQSDGNFVVYNGSLPLWSSGTFGNGGAELLLSTQTPQLEIIGSNQAVLWSNQ